MSTALLTPQDLQQFVDQGKLQATLITGIGDTPTVPAAAAALGVEPDQIVKTLLFLVELPGEGKTSIQPVIVISHGQKRIDIGRLAAHWRVGKKRVNLAPADVVVDLLGYPAGGVPPFGHRTRLPVIVDAAILTLHSRYGGVIYGGGGDDRTMLRLTVEDLLRVTGAEIATLG